MRLLDEQHYTVGKGNRQPIERKHLTRSNSPQATSEKDGLFFSDRADARHSDWIVRQSSSVQSSSVRLYLLFYNIPIVFPDIVKESRFTFDTTGTYIGDTAYIIPVNNP